MVSVAATGLVVASTLALGGWAFLSRSPTPAPDNDAIVEPTAATADVTTAPAAVAAPITWTDGWHVSLRPRLPGLLNVSPLEVGSYIDDGAAFRWTDAAARVISAQNPVLPAGTMRSGWFEFTENVAHVFRVSVLPSEAMLRQVCAFRLTVDGAEVMKADGIKLQAGVADEIRILSPTLRASTQAKAKLQLWHSCIKVTDEGNADSSELDNLLGSRERLNGKAVDAATETLLGAGLRIEVSRDGGDFEPVDGTEVSWPAEPDTPPMPGKPSFKVTELAYGQDWTEITELPSPPSPIEASGTIGYGIDNALPATPIRISTNVRTDQSGPHIIALAFGRENNAEDIVSCHVSGRLDDTVLPKAVVNTGHTGHGIWLHEADLAAGKHALALDVSCKLRGHRSLLLRKDKTPATDGVTITLMGRLPSEQILAFRADGMFSVSEAVHDGTTAQPATGERK